MMKSKYRTVIALFAMCGLAACDSGGDESLSSGIGGKAYREAMAEYSAGRLDQAAKGFVKTLREDPGNVSARFQLAVLQQDHAKDYFSALCNFRECIVLDSDEDRIKLAKERYAICEREAVREMVSKGGFGDAKAYADEITRLNGKLADAGRRVAEKEKEISDALLREEALKRELASLKALIKSDGDGESTVSSGAREVIDAKKLLEDDDEGEDRILNSDDIASLRAEEKLERSGAASLFLPPQPPEAKAERDNARKTESVRNSPESARPATYVVQEGDTLYRIALRFYGRIGAWSKIRDANKATISTDGRVKAGQTIKLP